MKCLGHEAGKKAKFITQLESRMFSAVINDLDNVWDKVHFARGAKTLAENVYVEDLSP